MSRYRLVHRTRYDYQAPVERSYGRAHLMPSDTSSQRCLSRSLTISPEAAETSEHRDYFGNISTFYLVRRPHRTLSVVAESELQIERDPGSWDAAALPWERVRDALTRTPDLVEFTLPSPRVRSSPPVDAFARDVLSPGQPIGELVDELQARIHREFRYRSGSTTVRSTVEQLLDQREGVCQDFAHLAVAVLRSAGLAARYVSGYLETTPAPGRPKLQGVDASHAWAAVFVPEAGWLEFDPTNNQRADDRYLVAAYGRDYGDVPPLKGIIVTDSTSSTLEVGVDVTRLD